MGLQYLLGMAGTVAFAATAVAAVAPKRIDVFGALVMGVITAIGGGTLRPFGPPMSITSGWRSPLAS